MAHQTHSLSWHLLAKHFKYQAAAITHKLTCSQPDIVPRQKGSQAADLTYFARGLAHSIQEFSTQFRSRYPSKEHYEAIAEKWTQNDKEGDEPGLKGRKVYSNEIMGKYPDDIRFKTSRRGLTGPCTPSMMQSSTRLW